MLERSGKQPHRKCYNETQNRSFTTEDTCCPPTVWTCPNLTCLTLINLNSGFKIGVTISWDLFWTHHRNRVVKNARRPHYLLRWLRALALHTCIIHLYHSPLSFTSITAWMGTVTRKEFLAPQREMGSAKWTIRTTLPNIYTKRYRLRANKIFNSLARTLTTLYVVLHASVYVSKFIFIIVVQL